MTDWTDNHKMTTDRKDGQSENYGFTLVINTPPPVYDSGSKPLEVVGERTLLNNNNMNEIYWITRLDAIQALAIIAVFILGIFIFLHTILWIMEDDEENKSKLKKIFLKFAAYISIPIFLLVFIPSKRDMLMIIGIGGTIEYLKSNDTANKLPDKVIMAIDKLLDDTIEEEK